MIIILSLTRIFIFFAKNCSRYQNDKNAPTGTGGEEGVQASLLLNIPQIPPCYSSLVTSHHRCHTFDLGAGGGQQAAVKFGISRQDIILYWDNVSQGSRKC